VGFDNITMSNYTDPPLTTVSIAKEFMGKSAVNLVLELIGNREAPIRRQEIPVELITRSSTARPHAR
jgi:LacI family transcriptional regulator, repressor for deo operon, udp, cdd, tsx, nupC, and nupG